MTIFPHELYENILSLAEDEDLWKSCSFVSREFRPIAQGLLFESIHLQCPTLEEPFAANYLTKKLDLPRNPESFSHIHAHIRVLSVYMHDIHVYTLEDKLGVFLGSLINLRSLALRDYGWPWSDISINLRTVLIKEVFPRLKVLYMRGLLKTPFLTILSSTHALRHLSISQFEAINTSEEIAKSPTMPLLQSLTVDTYAVEDFLESSTLIRAVDLCAKSLKSIILAEHAWGLHSRNASLSSAGNLLARYALNLTHLHIGHEIYGKAVAFEGHPNDHLHFSGLSSLEVLQFQLKDDNKENISQSFFSCGYLFFTWLAKELAEMYPPSALSQLICDLEYTHNPTLTSAVKVWEDLDKLLTTSGNFPHFERFRLRLSGPQRGDIGTVYFEMLQAALPLCSAKGYLRVENWKGRHEIVNSIVREHLHEEL